MTPSGIEPATYVINIFTNYLGNTAFVNSNKCSDRTSVFDCLGQIWRETLIGNWDGDVWKGQE